MIVAPLPWGGAGGGFLLTGFHAHVDDQFAGGIGLVGNMLRHNAGRGSQLRVVETVAGIDADLTFVLLVFVFEMEVEFFEIDKNILYRTIYCNGIYPNK